MPIVSRASPASLVVLSLLEMSVACGGGDDGDGGPAPGPGPREAILSGQIRDVRSLSAETTYTIQGIVRVLPGARLVAPAGTVLESDPNTQGSIVTERCDTSNPSGRVFLQGTATAPVVFRPRAAAGTRSRGQAGGIVLNGCAPVNGGSGTLTAIEAAYGGTDREDSSGEIQYLVIEFGGLSITDDEASALTLAGVGAGTRIDHVQTHFSQGDGIAWIGGTVNASFLVTSGASDDGFDCDRGWSGVIQFGVIVQDRELANRGVECDTQPSGSASALFTMPAFWNLTLIGAGVENANSEVNDGFYFRRDSGGAVRNSIVVDFGNLGAVIDGPESFDRLETEDLCLDNTLFSGNDGLASTLAQTSGNPLLRNVNRLMSGQYVADGLLDALDEAGGELLFVDPQLTSPSAGNPLDGTRPNLLPQAGSPALNPDNAARPAGTGIVDASARFLGAFSSSDWMDGWTVWALN